MSAALYFDADAYTESYGRAAPGGPVGLMGRQVAGTQFLDAYLSHMTADTFRAVVRSREQAEALISIRRDHPRKPKPALGAYTEAQILGNFAVPEPAVRVLHFPMPIEARFAWARRGTGMGVAFSGVTHTLSSVSATRALCDLVAAPFEECDALICTSHAVKSLVRAVTDNYGAYLAERFGGQHRLRPRLEVIPLGVNPDRFRPPTAAERSAERARLGAADDEVVVLCVGRLSHHAKAHPYPVFHAAEVAARSTGKKIVLIFAGWAAHPAVEKAYKEGAQQYAASVRTLFVDGTDPALRQGVWHAADVFVSLPDNIQETFGLVVVEAMASGLPVLGSEWDGYRDLIVDSETGYLAPTAMVAGATADATTRLLFGSVNYDHFLAECCQTAIVDPAQAGEALSRLVADADLRTRLGRAGRERVLKHFTWELVVRAYEKLWAEQEAAVRAMPPRAPASPTYPPAEITYAAYPTNWIADDVLLRSTGVAVGPFLRLPLTNLEQERRCSDPAVLAALLAAAPMTLKATVERLESHGIPEQAARATVAWLLKYGVLSSSEPEA